MTGAALAEAPRGKAPDVEKGRQVAERWCTECHIIDEKQRTASDAAPAFGDLAADPAKTPDALRAFLAAPQHPMPPIELSRTDIADLVAYIESLKIGR